MEDEFNRLKQEVTELQSELATKSTNEVQLTGEFSSSKDDATATSKGDIPHSTISDSYSNSNSEAKVAELEGKIESLKEQISEYEEQLEEFNQEIDTMTEDQTKANKARQEAEDALNKLQLECSSSKSDYEDQINALNEE